MLSRCNCRILHLLPTTVIIDDACLLFHTYSCFYLVLFLLLTEYDIVEAYEVDSDGNYITHGISHSHRRKRSAELSPVHLKIQGFRNALHLELKSAKNLLASGFTVQTFSDGRTKSMEVYQPHDFCFYQGTLLNYENSTVALSTCNGLVSESSTA